LKNGALKTGPLSEYLSFVRGILANPRGVGAIAPSSSGLGDAIAAQIDPARPGPVLELGPGSGSVTRAILRRGVAPGRLSVIERDPAFAGLIRAQYPGVDVIEGDAFALDRTLAGRAPGPFAAIVSCLPLLNFPQAQRQALMKAAMDRLAPNAPLIQFSYGMRRPADPPPGAGVTMAALVLKNLPPARVWVYRSAGKA
jgi:phosphatidylethanolamine/phosphatidyl-N-methylethanolamine N-methyltransferase